MRSNQLRGRSIVNDSAIHSLFSQLTDAHAKVLERMTKLEGQRGVDLNIFIKKPNIDNQLRTL